MKNEEELRAKDLMAKLHPTLARGVTSRIDVGKHTLVHNAFDAGTPTL